MGILSSLSVVTLTRGHMCSALSLIAGAVRPGFLISPGRNLFFVDCCSGLLSAEPRTVFVFTTCKPKIVFVFTTCKPKIGGNAQIRTEDPRLVEAML